MLTYEHRFQLFKISVYSQDVDTFVSLVAYSTPKPKRFWNVMKIWLPLSLSGRGLPIYNNLGTFCWC